MKHGRTHLAYEAEHALDLETEAIVAAEVKPADQGDTKSRPVTIEQWIRAKARLPTP